MTVNSTFTVVTQLLTDGNTTTTLSEIRRFYVQDGKVVADSYSTFAGTTDDISITDAYCIAHNTVFVENNSFASRGGVAAIAKAFSTGFVPVLSI